MRNKRVWLLALLVTDCARVELALPTQNVESFFNMRLIGRGIFSIIGKFLPYKKVNRCTGDDKFMCLRRKSEHRRFGVVYRPEEIIGRDRGARSGPYLGLVTVG